MHDAFLSAFGAGGREQFGDRVPALFAEVLESPLQPRQADGSENDFRKKGCQGIRIGGYRPAAQAQGFDRRGSIAAEGIEDDITFLRIRTDEFCDNRRRQVAAPGMHSVDWTGAGVRCGWNSRIDMPDVLSHCVCLPASWARCAIFILQKNERKMVLSESVIHRMVVLYCEGDIPSSDMSEVKNPKSYFPHRQTQTEFYLK
jgi:hypothetical protein